MSKKEIKTYKQFLENERKKREEIQAAIDGFKMSIFEALYIPQIIECLEKQRKKLIRFIKKRKV
jgi:hypothetical protein